FSSAPTTVLSRSRNNTSMENAMPWVWIPRQGTIQRPSPLSSPVRPIKPRRRVQTVSAICSFVASWVWRWPLMACMPRLLLGRFLDRLAEDLGQVKESRTQDDHQQRRKDAEEEREEQHDRGLGGRLFRPLDSLGAQAI